MDKDLFGTEDNQAWMRVRSGVEDVSFSYYSSSWLATVDSDFMIWILMVDKSIMLNGWQ